MAGFLNRPLTSGSFAANPGVMLAPKDFTPEMLKPLGSGEYQWNPERSTSGPITMLVSAADRTLYVYRNGEPIGRASIEVKGRLGGHVFTLLEGVSSETSPLAPGRPARKWMSVQSDAASRSTSSRPMPRRVSKACRANCG